MKFKLDENTRFILKKVIESLGMHQVDSVFHERITGIDDKSLNFICLNAKQILITLDNDFINLSDDFYGIIIIKPKTQGKITVKILFEQFVKNFRLEDTIGKLIILEPNQIRIREKY